MVVPSRFVAHSWPLDALVWRSGCPLVSRDYPFELEGREGVYIDSLCHCHCRRRRGSSFSVCNRGFDSVFHPKVNRPYLCSFFTRYLILYRGSVCHTSVRSLLGIHFCFSAMLCHTVVCSLLSNCFCFLALLCQTSVRSLLGICFFFSAMLCHTSIRTLLGNCFCFSALLCYTSVRSLLGNFFCFSALLCHTSVRWSVFVWLYRW